jgi:uncharacterized RDD family membrane protein YckC
MPDVHKDHPHEVHNEITIETLSSPPVHVPAAPLTRRVAAGAIDSLIIALAWFMLMTLGHQIPAAILTLSGGYLAIVTFVYYFLLEGVFGSTIGKNLLKLRVLQESGDACSIAAAFKRNLLRFVDWLPVLYFMGGVVISQSHERQRLGDMFAGTIVTTTPEKDRNPPPAPFLFH